MKHRDYYLGQAEALKSRAMKLEARASDDGLDWKDLIKQLLAASDNLVRAVKEQEQKEADAAKAAEKALKAKEKKDE